MIRHGEHPYLECSSRGDRRFSAFYARVKRRGNKTIEEIYQSAKVMSNPDLRNWKERKGLRAINQAEVTKLYGELWDEYIKENPHLLEILKNVSGLSDTFGQQGHCCQATELWRIRNEN